LWVVAFAVERAVMRWTTTARLHHFVGLLNENQTEKKENFDNLIFDI
jgi:hypothetical protein